MESLIYLLGGTVGTAGIIFIVIWGILYLLIPFWIYFIHRQTKKTVALLTDIRQVLAKSYLAQTEPEQSGGTPRASL